MSMLYEQIMNKIITNMNDFFECKILRHLSIIIMIFLTFVQKKCLFKGFSGILDPISNLHTIHNYHMILSLNSSILNISILNYEQICSQFAVPTTICTKLCPTSHQIL